MEHANPGPSSGIGGVRRWVVAWLLVAALTPGWSRPPADFDAWVDAFTTRWTGGGEPAASAAVPPRPDGAAAEGREADSNPFEAFHVRRGRRLALAREGLARLGEWPEAGLRADQRVSEAILRWHLELVVAQEPLVEFEQMRIFRQLRGLQVALVDSLTERHPLRRAADLEAYVRQLERVAPRIDEGIALTRAAAERGYILPTYILERSSQQVQMFLEPPAEENLFVTALRRRTAELRSVPAAARAAAIARATEVVSAQVRPAYLRLQTLLGELRGRATREAGMLGLPKGAAAYAHALRTYTTTTYTAGEIHAIGLREVARLEAEADRLLNELGYREGRFAERLARATTGSPVEGPDPRAVILSRYQEIIRDAQERSTALFNLKPRAPVEVRRIPPLTERTASAHYTAPSGDRPGIFWVPLPGSAFFFRAGMRTLAYHEAVPGHHFQRAIQQEQKDLPRFRARRSLGAISAHSEGWALYVERLAVEQGWYEGDRLGLLGALGSELFRARRLVVDTGLQVKGWTREQAIAYGISASEVERYIVNPGQACSYMIGMLRLLELREQARQALGPRFSLPDFHDVILKTGTVPLAVLDGVIADWIASRQ